MNNQDHVPHHAWNNSHDFVPPLLDAFSAALNGLDGGGPALLELHEGPPGGATTLRSPSSTLSVLSCILVSLVASFVVSSAFAQQTNCTPRPDGLVAWWPGDGFALDVVGTNHGTLQAGATYASGNAGLAFSLDGSSSYIQIPNSPVLDFNLTTPMSVELWAYRTGGASIMHLIGKRNACGGIQYQMAFDSSGMGFSSDYGGATISGWQLPLNAWVHLAATFDGSTFRFYTNGVLGAIGTGTLGPAHATPLEIGKSGTCGYTFAGLIDEVAFFNRALSSNEIAAIYQAGSFGMCRPPQVTATTPANGKTRVPTETLIKATFSKPMDAATITTNTFLLKDNAGVPVVGLISYDATTLTATYTPVQPLVRSNVFTATIKASITDVSGNTLLSDVSWSFQTTSDGFLLVGNKLYEVYEVKVDQDAWSPGGLQFAYPAAAAFSDGRFVVGWPGEGNNGRYRVFDQYVNPITSPTVGPSGVWGTSVYSLTNSDFVLIAGNCSGGCQPYWNIFRETTSGWQLSASGAASGVLGDWPGGASTPDGDFYVFGVRDSSPFMVRCYNVLGSPYGPAFQVNTSSISGWYHSAIACSAYGKMAAGWVDQNHNLWGRTFANHGTQALSDPFLIGNSPTISNPCLRYSTNEELVVVWDGNPVGISSNGIWTVTLSSTGTVTRGPSLVSAAGGWSPHLAVNTNGDSIVSWNRDGQVFGRFVRADGSPITDEFKVNQYTNGSRAQSGTTGRRGNIILPGGTVIISWGGSGAQGSGIYLTCLRFASDIVIQDLNLVLSQQHVGTHTNPYFIDRWNFTGSSGQQVHLDQVAMSSPGVLFDLQGPAGWIGFQGVQGQSDVVTLPASGSYVLVARGTGGASPQNYTFRLQEMVPTTLSLGEQFSGYLSGNGQAQLFQIVLPAGSPMRVVLNNSPTGNRNEIYLQFGSPPTRGQFDYRFNAPGSSQQIDVASAYAGTWYILVYGDTIITPSDFSLEVTTPGMYVNSVSPDSCGSSADSVLTLTGAGFDSSTTVAFISTNGVAYSNCLISIDSFTQLTVTIHSNSVPPGLYTVRVSQTDGDISSLTNALTVEANAQGVLETRLIVPSSLGRHATATLFVEYANTGNAAMPAPLLVLSGTERPFLTLHNNIVTEGFWTSAQPAGFSDKVQFLASGSTPGILQPGETVRVPVYYAGLQQPWSWNPTTSFSLGWLPTDFSQVPVVNGVQIVNPNNYIVDWASLKSGMRPASIDAGAWDIIWANFTADAGSTWFNYVQMLARRAFYLSRNTPIPLGGTIPVNDTSDLLAFEFMKADDLGPLRTLAGAEDASVEAPGLPLVFTRSFPATISGRFEQGPLGRGWSHNWQYSLQQESDGTVDITGPGGSRRTFKPDSRWSGKYFPQAGDHGTLTPLGGGAFSVREPSGLIRAFRSDGKLDYMEDLNGNRITCGYSGNLLTSLTHASGQSLTLGYSGGHIQTITDSVGRQTVFSYTGEHLTGVQYYDGRTAAYDYNLSGPSIHALTHVARSCCTHQYFEYESHGWLYQIHRGGGAEAVTFSYDSTGKVTATDALGHSSKFYFDHRGLLVKAENPLGNAVYLGFDDDYNLTSLTDPAGHSYGYGYDGNGNLTSNRDPLGHVTRFTFGGSFNRLASVTDANSNPTQYGYDKKGNLNSITYANSSRESWAYDAQGNAITWTNRRSHPISYAYDGSGRITNKLFLDGSRIDLRLRLARQPDQCRHLRHN